MEISPFRFQNSKTKVKNNGSWHWHTNLLFVDQPVGTAFSYIDIDSLTHELDEIANQFLGFLDQYIEIFPELLENDIYLAGESFAGQFISYIARAILEKKSILKLSGLLIGNSWIDPINIYESYLPFAVANNLVVKNSELYNSINDQVILCRQILSKQIHVFDETCNVILHKILKDGTMNNQYARNQRNRCTNVYDIRLDDTYPDCGTNWLTDLKYITSYLHRKDVMSYIHVDSKKLGWTKCSDPVYYAFRANYSQSFIKLLPNLLRHIPVVLYSNEYDLICNHWGTEAMISNMIWNNRTGFDLRNGTFAHKESWIIDDKLK